MHVIALSFIYLLCTVYYLCVCDYDAHECFVRSFFPKQAKQNQSSLVTRNILPPHISRSILLTCKGRVVTWLRVEKVCERKVFLCLFVLSTYFLVSWLVTFFYLLLSWTWRFNECVIAICLLCQFTGLWNGIVLEMVLPAHWLCNPDS